MMSEFDSSILIVAGIVTALLCFVYGVILTVKARQAFQPLDKAGAPMILGTLGMLLLVYFPPFYRGSVIENEMLYILFTRVRSFAIHIFPLLILTCILLMIPPKQVAEDGTEIPNSKRKGCFIGLALTGAVFFGMCGFLFSAVVR